MLNSDKQINTKMRAHILHNGLHRIGDRPSRILDNERFLSRDPFDEPWMTKTSTAAANVKADKEFYDLEIALPGFTKDQVRIEVNQQNLSIIAEKKDTHFSVDEPQYIRREYSTQALYRSFDLPDHIQTEEIEACLEDGLLKIKLPHSRKLQKAKKIEVL